MKIITSVAAMQRLALAWKRDGIATALVPTMGFLHEGHLSLVSRARSLVKKSGVVILSIYVNPTQFGPHEDLSKYPRDLAADRNKCKKAGVDVLFVPPDAEVYACRAGLDYSTFITESGLSQYMEGHSRPGHFRGVATIVAKLFNITLPDFAVFGAKDFQQAAMITKMTRDLNFPVKIVVSKTCREPDGLALSSRNKYLSREERPQATVLFRSIQTARRLTKHQPVSTQILKAEIASMVAAEPAARLDYVSVFDPETLVPLAYARRGARIALAVFIGKTRLIDNAVL